MTFDDKGGARFEIFAKNPIENRVGRGNLILIDVSASVYRILKIVHYEHWCRNAFIFSKIILVPSIFLFS